MILIVELLDDVMHGPMSVQQRGIKIEWDLSIKNGQNKLVILKSCSEFI